MISLAPGFGGIRFFLLLRILLTQRSNCQVVYINSGLLAEYFAPLPASQSCDRVNGSTLVLQNLVPTIVRRDQALSFPNRQAFNIDKCSWQLDPDNRLAYVCRGQEELLKNFAVRWTGSLYIYKAGDYNFTMTADSGARFIIGYNKCPGSSCATRFDVDNSALSQLQKTYANDGSFGNMCAECGQGIYKNCWVTNFGCEPFGLWQLEADGGLSGSCSNRRQVVSSSRYLSAGYHPIRIEYFQRNGGAGEFSMQYSGPDTNFVLDVIPGNKLQHPKATGLVKEWFDLGANSKPTTLPPAALYGMPPVGAKLVYKVQADTFEDTVPGREGALSNEVASYGKPVYVRWTGFLSIVIGGNYKFRVTSNKGVRLVVGGRGGGEFIAVNNDGFHDAVDPVTQVTALLAGLNPIRIDYYWAIDETQADAMQSPPGIDITYEGPDAPFGPQLLSTLGGALFTNYDIDCFVTHFRENGGMSQNRDCAGKCFAGTETQVGDSVCDDGRSGPLVLTCPQYNSDNNDCNPSVNKYLLTTPRPTVQCLVSCGASNWIRKDCSNCELLSEDGKTCLKSYSNGTSFTSCCAARLFQIPFWGTDCIAFGSIHNCTYDLSLLLKQLAETKQPLDVIGSIDPKSPPPAPSGYLLQDCNTARCNTITKDLYVNPFTGLETKDLICPVGESKKPGIMCYVGPWEITKVSNVLQDCEDGNFNWNFCLNHKTIDGRPFSSCCNFLYLNYRGEPECRMVGIAQGSCAGMLQALTQNLSTSPYTAITNAEVIMDCSRDKCNDPSNADTGCPASVIQKPAISAGIRPTGVPDLDTILKGSSARPPDGPNWILVGCLSSVPVVLVLLVWFLIKYCKTPEKSPWYSAKATVIAHDTWVEPATDKTASQSELRDLAYGTVKPRPEGFKALQDKIVPEALLLDPDRLPAEAANAAWADALANRAEKLGIDIGEFYQTPQVIPGTTYTSSGGWRNAIMDDDDWNSVRSPSVANTEGRASHVSRTQSTVQSSQAALTSGPASRPSSASSRTSRTSRHRSKASRSSRKRSASVVSDRSNRSGHSSATSNEDEAEVPRPPEAVVLWHMAEVEGSVSGNALPTVPAPSIAGRPAAAARMLRQGVPRMAYVT